MIKKSMVVAWCMLLLQQMSFAKEKIEGLPEDTTAEKAVFVSEREGYQSYRIPAIIKLKNGDLLAFCEGRVAHAGDFGDIDIVMKRSADNGKTWNTLQKVVDYGDLQAGNPAPVVDLTDPAYPQGRIFLFYNTGNNHEGEVRRGKGVREVWYVTSTDHGQTWSEPVNITLQTHRPNQPAFNPAYRFKEDWRSYANTPGHAVQLEAGKFKGRIFIAANHSAGMPQDAFKDYRAHGYYTDDHGKTFKLGESVSFEGGNESMAAELTGGRLLMNTRNQQGQVRNRIVSISKDGGATWDTTFYDKQLPDPVNQGSVLSFLDKRNRILAFCNAAATQNRDSLTLRLSKDDGQHWFYNKRVATAPLAYKGGYAAYSDLVRLGKRTVGILYEKDNYKSIVFIPVKWK
ncbi:exo-alpha-sialidase [Olivibacter sp. XZL3]|uniref:sialidase family protein n=1 Tax=Olivibacter sp. XZL3 TaxID=1735116 RepID=UPI001F0FC28D|nr:sialidase family protein [Olivibacter sp. XZL3]